jgi:hypothetical protein
VKKLLLLLSLLLSHFALAQTTTTITGTIRDLTDALVTSGQITFTLRPSTDVTESGLARFTTQTITCAINSSGQVVGGSGSGSCTITMNTALQPPGSGYLVTFLPYNVKTATIFMYALTSSLDITTVVSTQAQLPSLGGVVDTFSNQTISGNKTFTGNTTINASNTGVFTNTQLNTYLTSIVGTISPSALFFAQHSGYDTEGMTGAVGIPVGSTVTQGTGVYGYAQTSASSSGRTVNNAVGIAGQAQVAVSGGAGWGANTLCADAVGLSNINCTGYESDVNVYGNNANGWIVGFISTLYSPGGATMPTCGGCSFAFVANSATPSTIQWPHGYYIAPAAVKSTGAAFWADRACLTGSCSSNGIWLTGFDGTTSHVAQMNADSSGDWVITAPSGAGVRSPARAVSTYPACSSSTEGMQATITDSTTNTWGATITGSGSDHVLGYCDGTNWTVAAK